MKKYTIAKYIRLSMEDLDLCDSEEKAESVSISNQRNFINVFMEQKEEFKGAEVRVQIPAHPTTHSAKN